MTTISVCENIDSLLTSFVLPEQVSSLEEEVSRYTREKIDELSKLSRVVQASLKKIKQPKVHPGGPSIRKISADQLFCSIVKKTGQGCAGITFVFNMTPNSISGTFLSEVRSASKEVVEQIQGTPEYSFAQQDLKLIFKWSNPEDQIIQSIYNQIYRRCGFLSPHSVLLEDRDEVIQKICTVASGNKLIIPASMSFATAVGFRAGNLSDAMNGGAFSSFSPVDWNGFFSHLGKMSVIDMLLGNHDRVIHYSSDLQRISPHWNFGNIMIDVEKRKIFAIDNGIDLGLLPKMQIEAEEVDYFVGGDVEMKEPEPTKPPEPLESPACKLDLLHRYFNSFLHTVSSPVSLKQLATEVVTSFFEDPERMDPDKGKDVIPQCTLAWTQGVLEMLKALKEKNKEYLRDIGGVFVAQEQGDRAFRNALFHIVEQNINLLSTVQVGE